jgi:hypothetical protein
MFSSRHRVLNDILQASSFKIPLHFGTLQTLTTFHRLHSRNLCRHHDNYHKRNSLPIRPCYTAFRLHNRTEIYVNQFLIKDYDWDVANPIVICRPNNGSAVITVNAANFSIVIVRCAIRIAALAERVVRGCAK